MTDIVLDEQTRALTVGEFLNRNAGPLRLHDPAGDRLWEVVPSKPLCFTAGTEEPSPSDDPADCMTGSEMRAYWHSLDDRKTAAAGEAP